MRLKYLITSLLIVVSVIYSKRNAYAQKHSFIPIHFQPVVESIYNFQFHKADSLLKAEKSKDNNWFLLMKSNYYWWMILTGEESKENIASFDFYVNSIIKNLGKVNIHQLLNEDLYIIANAYAFKTRLSLYKSNYIAAASNLNNCIKYIEASLGKEVAYEPFHLTSGLYNYFVDYAAKKYTLIRPYLATMPKGSTTKGFTLLYKLAVSKDWILNNEANYFLCKLFQETEKNYVQAEKYAEVMYKRYPSNIAYAYNYFDILLNQDKIEEARKELVKINVLSKTLPLLTVKQRAFYLNKAQNDLKEYYKKKSE